MEIALPLMGIIALAILAGQALKLAYRTQSTWRESVKGQLDDLDAAKVTHMDSSGGVKKSSVLSIIDLDLHIEHLHRGRCILQSGLLIVAVVAIVCITALCPKSLTPTPKVAILSADTSPTNTMPVNAKSNEYCVTGTISVAVNEPEPDSTNQIDAAGK
jgi:hypothetical protein